MLGLPGAGKTTLTALVTSSSDWRSIAQVEERANLRPRNRPRHKLAQRVLPQSLQLRLLNDARPDAKDAGTYAARQRAHLDAVMLGADLVTDTAARELAVELMFESWSEHGFSTRFGERGDALIHHESVLQRAAFLLALLPPSKEADAIVETLPLPDGVVLLQLPLETAVNRVRARVGGFTMTEVMPSMERWIATIVAHLQSEGVPVAEVDAEREPTVTLPEVLAFLDERCRPSPDQGSAD